MCSGELSVCLCLLVVPCSSGVETTRVGKRGMGGAPPDRKPICSLLLCCSGAGTGVLKGGRCCKDSDTREAASSAKNAKAFREMTATPRNP